ncbi:MAG: AAA family ATPase, partial [Patescibacteria group bacterium]|nr:AAA family ATPase [Patescibacteria group bacterium]
MEYVDIKKSRIHRAVMLDRVLPRAALRKVVWTGFFVMLLSGALVVLAPKILGESRTLGFGLIAGVCTFGFWVYTLFFETYLDLVVAPRGQEENLAEYLDFGAVELFEKAFPGGRGNISALLLEIAKLPSAKFVLYRVGVSPENFAEGLKAHMKAERAAADSENLTRFMKDALDDKRKFSGGELLSWHDLFVTLCVHSDFLKELIFEKKLEKKDIRDLVEWARELELQQENAKKFWSRTSLMRTRGIGKDWASGYTLKLDRFAHDLSDMVLRRGFVPHLYGRRDETEAVEEILARSGKNNVVLVGEEGVGKKTIAHALAKNIVLGQTLAQLAHKRVMELDVAAVLAGAATEHAVEERFKFILNDAVRAGNVILLVDHLHSLFDRSGSGGTVDATEILSPYLNSSLFQVIGLTTHEGYHETIARNPSIARLFEKIEIKEPSRPEVMEILRDVVPQIEAHDEVLVSYQAMKKAVELADRYIKTVPFPEKAISVLQEAAVFAKTKRHSSMVTAEHIEEVVHRRTEIPVGQIALAEKDVLLNLEQVLHRKVVGQEDAIVAIANALRRARSGIGSEKRPIGGFLFLGPTGVGKTETAKALASVYFGSEKHMLRFDMSEYQQADSIHRLIGHDAEPGQLTTAVMDRPFSLVLLDEIEKAHPNILNVFLQVLDDGRLTDALGRTVDFTNTIIID